MPDPFHVRHRELTDVEKALVQRIKEEATSLYVLIDCTPGRESALAKTKLEEAVMWAVKGITK